MMSDEDKIKETQAILNAYLFLSCDVADYADGRWGDKAAFKHELQLVLKELETYVAVCDPEKMHGNHL